MRLRLSIKAKVQGNAMQILRLIGVALSAVGAIIISVLLFAARPRIESRARQKANRGCDCLKIAYLRTDLWGMPSIGGSQSHAEGFAEGIYKTGNDIFILASGELGSGIKRAVRTYIVKPPGRSRLAPLSLYILAYNITFLKRALCIFRRELPDIICQRHSVLNITGTILSRIVKIPLVIEYNSSAFWKREKSETIRLRALLRGLEKVSLAFASRIMVVSRVLHKQLISRGIDPRRIFINPNGADCQMFRPDIDGNSVRRRLGLGQSLVVGIRRCLWIVAWRGVFGACHQAGC